VLREGVAILYLTVLLLLAVGPPVIAGIVAKGHDPGEPRRARPFVWAALVGVVTAGGIHLASLDIDGMAALGYGYAILASLAGSMVSFLGAVGLWVAARHHAPDKQ
jgi:hypothetical protein